MNTIEKELQLNIFGEVVDRFNPFTHKKTDKEVVESCLSIVEKHSIEYKKYVCKYFIQVKRVEPFLYTKRNDKFTSNIEQYDSSIYNENELFKLYTQSLIK